jgi:hypothetical protein
MILAALVAGVALAAEGEAAPPGRTINVAIITGGHAFNEKDFMTLFEGYEDIACRHMPQKDDSEGFEDIDYFPYDVMVFYNMGQKISEKRQKNLISLLEKGVGVVALHHCLAAWQDWPEFKDIIGGKFYLEDRTEGGVKHAKCGARDGVTFKVHIEDADHPVTQGLKDFEIKDETYKGYWVDPKVHAILTTDEPSNEKVLGWTKTYAKAKVCYLMNGHDRAAYTNPSYRTLLIRAVRWAAGRLADKPAAARPEPARVARTVYAAPAAEEKPAARNISVAVVTGGHGFEEKPFLTLFQGYDDIQFKHLPGNQDGEIFEDTSALPYQVIVLYNMGQKISEKRQKNFIGLLQKGTGLVALHHCIGGWQDWPEYRTIIGGKFFTKPDEINGVKYPVSPWKDDVDYKIHIEDTAHPITQGLADFAIKDETYKGFWVDPQVHVLLTTDEPTCGKTVGWTKTYGKANVCYLMNGHGPSAFANKEFRTLVVRAIRWAAPAK